MNILTYVHLRRIHNATGVGRVARQMIEHLLKDPEDEIHILADPLDYQKVLYQLDPTWKNLNYHLTKHETSWQQARWLFLQNPVAEQYWTETQLVYCPAESYVPTRRSRLVVTLHDVAYFENDLYSKTLSTRFQKIKWQIMHNILSKKADSFHVVSQFSADRVAHFFPEMLGRIKVIPNGVAPIFFGEISPEGEAYIRRLGLNGQPFVLLPGGLNFRKNAELVLKCWAVLHEHHPEIKLVVSSHSDPNYIERIKTLGDSVILTGFVSDEALCALYKTAQVVWFPSLYEGFGMPVLESMACGTPVVTSDSSSLPEVVGNAAIIVSTKSVTEHIDAISGILTDLKLREELIRLGKIRSQQFTWQLSANKLRQHFLSLL